MKFKITFRAYTFIKLFMYPNFAYYSQEKYIPPVNVAIFDYILAL